MRSRHVLLTAACLIIPLGVFAQEEGAAPEEEPMNPVIAAVQDGNARDLTTALGEGADPNTKTDAGAPVLHVACIKGAADIVTALLEGGADIESTDETGATALMYAAQFDHDDIVAALIEAGANVNAKDSLGWTPLIRAVIGGNAEAVSALLEAGADKSATDFFGRDAARVAEGRDLDEIVGILNGTAPSSGE